MENAVTVMYLNKHTCRPCKHFENLKPPVARKHRSFVCLTASFLATGGFVKLFHKIQLFFHDYSGFFKFHDFSMHGTFFLDFPGFP